MATFGLQPGSFQFSGDPMSQALAAKAYQGERQARAQENASLYGAQGQWRAAQEQANAARDTTLYQQPSRFADTLAGLYGQLGGAGVGALGAYANPYSQATQSLFGGQAALGRSMGDLYGSGVSALGSMGTAAAGSLGGVGSSVANAAGQIGSSAPGALSNLYGSANSAMANAHSNSLGALAARDSAAGQAVGKMYDSVGALGSSNQSALAGLDAARAAALANQSVAAANGYGQMATANYNMQGMLGNAAAQVAAAEAAAMGNAAAAQQAAGPQYAKLQFLSGAMPQLLDTIKYGFQAAPYGMSGLSGFGSGGGDIGFTASGPGGLIAAGSGGSAPSWSGGSSGGGQFVPPPAPPSTGPIAPPSFAPPALPSFGGGSGATRSFLDTLLQRNDAPTSQANLLRADMGRQLDANRAATMNPETVDSLNRNLKAGYDKLTVQPILDALPRDGYSGGGVLDAIRGNTESGATGIDGAMSKGLGALGGLFADAASNMQGTMGAAAGYINPMISGGVGAMTSMADRMGSTYDQFGSNMRSAYDSTQKGLSDAYQQTYGGVNSIWNNSLGKVRQFMSPSDLAREEAAAKGITGRATAQRDFQEAQDWLARNPSEAGPARQFYMNKLNRAQSMLGAA